jgi:hypothetical protein
VALRALPRIPRDDETEPAFDQGDLIAHSHASGNHFYLFDSALTRRYSGWTLFFTGEGEHS